MKFRFNTGCGPSSLAKLVYKYNNNGVWYTITIFRWGYKPTNRTGEHHPVWIESWWVLESWSQSCYDFSAKAWHCQSLPTLKTENVGNYQEPCTIWLFNIAMENGPFIDDFPIKPSIYTGFSMAMLNNQMVIVMLVMIPNNLQLWITPYMICSYGLMTYYKHENWSRLWYPECSDPKNKQNVLFWNVLNKQVLSCYWPIPRCPLNYADPVPEISLKSWYCHYGYYCGSYFHVHSSRSRYIWIHMENRIHHLFLQPPCAFP